MVADVISRFPDLAVVVSDKQTTSSREYNFKNDKLELIEGSERAYTNADEFCENFSKYAVDDTRSHPVKILVSHSGANFDYQADLPEGVETHIVNNTTVDLVAAASDAKLKKGDGVLGLEADSQFNVAIANNWDGKKDFEHIHNEEIANQLCSREAASELTNFLDKFFQLIPVETYIEDHRVQSKTTWGNLLAAKDGESFSGVQKIINHIWSLLNSNNSLEVSNATRLLKSATGIDFNNTELYTTKLKNIAEATNYSLDSFIELAGKDRIAKAIKMFIAKLMAVPAKIMATSAGIKNFDNIKLIRYAGSKIAQKFFTNDECAKKAFMSIFKDKDHKEGAAQVTIEDTEKMQASPEDAFISAEKMAKLHFAA